MVSRAELRRLRQTVGEAAEAAAGRVDTSGMGERVMSNRHSRVYLDADADGQPVSTMVTRSGGVMRVIGVDLRCVVGACDCPAGSHPGERQPDAPTAEAVDAPQTAAQPQPVPMAQPDADQPPAADQPPWRPNPYGRLMSGDAADAEAEGIRDIQRDRRGY